jgi:hypothetical protein
MPPTPQKRLSATLSSGRSSPGPVRTPTPSNEDIVLGTGKSNISRSGSGQTGSSVGIRGPRLARGGGRGGSVQNMVHSLNRSSMSGPSSPPPSSSPKKINRLSGSPVRRPSNSVVGRSAAGSTQFSRRTMASDAEDDVVDRK